MTEKLSKKEMKTLKNALGKQGLTIDDHKNAQKSAEKCEILAIDCFSLEESKMEGNSDGWYVGYGVEYNGVGVSAAQESSESDAEVGPAPENREISDESSGFSSDPPSEGDEIPEFPENLLNRRESDDISDKGQLMYGVNNEKVENSTFFVEAHLIPKKSWVKSENGKKGYETGEIDTTKRFPISKCSQSDEETHNGYQIINENPENLDFPCPISHSDDENSEKSLIFPEFPTNSTFSSGLWCNFIISPPDLDEKIGKTIEKMEISEEKLKTIPLDGEKLAQISAAMANFKLPTPPGWENVSDAKLLEFIKQRV